jgi:hypothetical protein
MSTRTTAQQRRAFYGLHVAGQTYRTIAERFAVSVGCVRYWCRRQREDDDSRSRAVGRPTGHLREFDPLVRYVILRLKREHPRWGPRTIRHHLTKRPSLGGMGLPSPASIGRYLHQWPCLWRQRVPKIPRPSYPPPQRVHEVWQMDFKVAIPYGDQWLHLHTVRDPVSSVYIGAFLFVVPCASSQVSFEQVRLTLRQCFQQWGTLPERIQTDGEASLVNLHHVQSPFPTPFILWLTGLGIAHVVIHRVTQNAEVERCHRSLWDYVLSGSRLPPMPERQTLLDQALYELNHELSSRAHGCNGYPPLTAHPEALCPPRPYRRDHELQLFDVRKVEAYLSNRTWQRQITANGTVQLGGQANRYSVGRAYARQTVTVHFDATDRHFVFSSTAEPPVILRRLPAKHLTAADLTGLTDGSASLGPQQLALPYLLEG